jgi:hypothetical protein
MAMEQTWCIPEDYCCPITRELMRDPVMMKDGQTYEREAIAAALARNPNSPITRQPLNMADAVQNFALKRLIDTFRSTRFPIKIRHPNRTGTAEIQTYGLTTPLEMSKPKSLN